MGKPIVHTGIIRKVTPDTVTLSITPESNDCGGCAIAPMCNKSELLEVPYPGLSADAVGKRATFTAAPSSQMRAIILLLVVPLIILVTTLIIALLMDWSEALSMLLSVSLTALWFVFLWHKRSAIQQKIRFTISLDQ